MNRTGLVENDKQGRKFWDRFNTDYKSKCAFGSFQSQRRFDLVTAFTPVYTGYILKRTFGAF